MKEELTIEELRYIARTLYERSGLTQSEIANRLEVSVAIVNRSLNGDGSCGWKTLTRIISLFKPVFIWRESRFLWEYTDEQQDEA